MVESDNLVLLWVPTSSAPLMVMRGHESTVYAAVFATVMYSDGTDVLKRQPIIISAGSDQKVCDKLAEKAFFVFIW